MTVVSTTQDLDARTLTVVAALPAPPERVWQAWADPRQVERWWGPPQYPATFTEHDLSVGATCRYFMTGPTGERHYGWWRIEALDEPRSLEMEDGFADAEGIPDAALPITRMTVELQEMPDGTQMTITSRCASREQLEQLVQMGMVEGMSAALGQLDDVVAPA